MRLLKYSPITLVYIHGVAPLCSCSIPLMLFFIFNAMSLRSSVASWIFCLSRSGLSVYMNGRHTYDSGIISENAPSRCHPLLFKSLRRILMALPTLSPHVHNAYIDLSFKSASGRFLMKSRNILGGCHPCMGKQNITRFSFVNE